MFGLVVGNGLELENPRVTLNSLNAVALRSFDLVAKMPDQLLRRFIDGFGLDRYASNRVKGIL